jgi:hypothetical protein
MQPLILLALCEIVDSPDPHMWFTHAILVYRRRTDIIDAGADGKSCLFPDLIAEFGVSPLVPIRIPLVIRTPDSTPVRPARGKIADKILLAPWQGREKEKPTG